MTGASSRPLEHLAQIGRSYPGVWPAVEQLRAGRGTGLPDWPRWCFLPLVGWSAIATRYGFQSLGDICSLAAIGAWAYSKGIYRFDPTIESALKEAEILGDLPADVLLRLPEWSLYILTPGDTFSGVPMHGFWASLEYDVTLNRAELLFVIDTAEGFVPHLLPLGPWGVLESVKLWQSAAEAQRVEYGFNRPAFDDDLVKSLSKAVQPLLSRVLYLCSDEPEVEDVAMPGAKPRYPAPSKTKSGSRIFHAKKPRVWDVACGLGGTLREAVARHEQTLREGGYKGVRAPHLRRPHWHWWWRGPVRGKREAFYKFLPPTFVDTEKRQREARSGEALE